jgi:IS4 transposase
MGIRGKIVRSTLADANEKRDWHIYADFAQILIHEARTLNVDDELGLQLKETVYALDATIIDLCLSVSPWARFRKTKAGIKMHTLFDLKGNIPSFCFFVVRAKSNTKLCRLYSDPVDRSTGLRCDQVVTPETFYADKDYPEKLRLVKFYDAKNKHYLRLLTNQFTLPALTITDLYRLRWQVELFFKWIKEHLRIKAF